MSTLSEICEQRLVDLGFDSETYRKRLEDDLWQIAAQGEEEYFLDLYNRGVKYPNQHNLFVAKLLGISDDFDNTRETDYVMGEFPDIDIDFLPDLRDYLKNEWAVATYGRERVCNIINYSTFGIKMSILDVAKIYGFPREQINPMTKPLGKDEDGHELTIEDAKSIFPDLAAWLDENPQVEDSIRRIVGRSKSKGKHAGGLIISSKDLSDFVPLTIDSDGNPTAAWPEGQASQDLQTVGLVKLDVLGLKDLERINRICDMVRKDLGVQFLCARPDSDEEWSDSRYLNDPAAIALANAGDTTGIFQFESSGMREILRTGGVDRFEDLSVYNALYRPGPMGMKMHLAYCERKKGREEWTTPDLLKPITASTYGVLAFQEQIMKVLNLVGDIPLVQCEAIRKAISKKKGDIFEAAGVQFMTNGLNKPGMTKEILEKLWQEILAFAGYGFNKSHSVGYSILASRLLYLKAHYPLQFYTVSLQMEGVDADVAGLIVEARSKGIEVHPPNFEKSLETFSVVDGAIYAGFSNIKGIGYEVAKRIVDNRPYASYEDFLEKFGTDAVVHRAFGAIGLLDHFGDPIKVYDFCLGYKQLSDKNRAAEKSRQRTTENQLTKIRSLIPEGSEFSDAEYLKSLPYDEVKNYVKDLEHAKELTTLIRRFIKGQQKYAAESLTKLPTLENHEADGNLTEDELILFGSRRSAEQKYFGFYWESPLNGVPGLKGWTFQTGFSPKEGYRYVECLVVKKPMQQPTKKGGVFYRVEVEDAIGRRETVIFWDEDYKKFSSALNYWDDVAGHGNILRVFLSEPGKFNSYTLYSQPRWSRAAEFEPDYRLGFDYRLECVPKS